MNRTADELDFRTATGTEALEWFNRQAASMDDALGFTRSHAVQLAAVLDFVAIVSALVGELLRRVGDEPLRGEARR